MKKVLSICVIAALFAAFSTVCSFGLSNSNNKIIAPKTVKVGKKFKITLRGEKDTMIGTRTGQKKFIPDSWTISNNAVDSDYFFDIVTKPDFLENYGLYAYKSNNIKFSYPGKYTIRAEFYIATLHYDDDPDYSDDFSYLSTNFNDKYTKTKKINVLGKVRFNPGKGTLKKASKLRWRAQNAKIGKLPKPKRKGYTFKGWYTGKGGKGKKIKASTRAKFTGSTKNYYAKWKKR